MTPELETALADLDLRAMLDPRLEEYRVAPGEASLRGLPHGAADRADIHVLEPGVVELHDVRQRGGHASRLHHHL